MFQKSLLTTTGLTSAGSPIRPVGSRFNIDSLNEPVGSSRDHAPFVSIGPGAMATKRRPYRPHSAASDRVKALTPAARPKNYAIRRAWPQLPFADADGATNPDPTSAYVVEIDRNTPRRCALIRRRPTSSVTFAVPLSTMSTTVFHALGDSRSEGETKLPAALLITISGSPTDFSHSSIAAATAPASRTSAGIATTRPPVAAVISLAAPLITSGLRDDITTVAPSRESIVAIAFPSPVPPPCT